MEPSPAERRDLDTTRQIEPPMTPGYGVSGLVLCPLLRNPCVKSACEFWVELTYAAGTPDQHQVGRCAYAWQAILQAENTQAINRLVPPSDATGPTGVDATTKPQA